MTSGREVSGAPSSWSPTGKIPRPRVRSRRVSVVRALLSTQELGHDSNQLSPETPYLEDQSTHVETSAAEIPVEKEVLSKNYTEAPISEVSVSEAPVVYTDDLKPTPISRIHSTSVVAPALRKSPPRSRSTRSASAAALLAELAKPGRWAPPTLSVDNISQEFTTHSGTHRVLDGIQLTFNSPGIHVLFGPPGCGKSVLLRRISGKPMASAEGEIRVGGDRVMGFSRDIISLGSMESNRLDLNVLENVVLPFRWRAWADFVSRSEQKLRVKRVLDKAGLSYVAHKYPHQLSLDQNLRLVWARALVLKPRVLLVDDPFKGVDSLHRTHLRDIARKLILQQSCTVIFTTSDLSEALQLADRLVVLTPAPSQVCLDFELPRGLRKTTNWPHSREAEQLRSQLLEHLKQWPAFAC